MSNIILLETISDEPRISDIVLADRLGFINPRQIRELIIRNMDELEEHGGLSYSAINPTAKGGRPGKMYYLNEPQALTICALSRTPVAAQVRKALIQAFMAYRSKPVLVHEHRRRLPSTSRRLASSDMHEAYVSFFRAFKDKPEALADWAVASCMQMLPPGYASRR